VVSLLISTVTLPQVYRRLDGKCRIGGITNRKETLTLVIPKPGLSARNLLSAGSETTDSSRDKPALRNDKPRRFSRGPPSLS
jgi:hypothetical protein